MESCKRLERLNLLQSYLRAFLKTYKQSANSQSLRVMLSSGFLDIMFTSKGLLAIKFKRREIT